MRLLSLFLSVLLMSSAMFAQQKYLVSPNDEVIPLRKGESSSSIIAKHGQRALPSSAAVCGNQFTFGYPPDKFPPTSNFGARHKDVMGGWFVAKATGTIDTIFWQSLGSVGAKDSLLYVRVHNSVIGPSYGPGAPGTGWKPPCQNWGYWVNTNDLDQGVAAFIEDATDTTWISTIAAGPPTGKPFGSSLWGFTGYPVINHANQINNVAMMEIGTPLNVTVGQQFFISQRVNGPATHPVPLDGRTEWASAGFRVSNTDENYPSRNWKFYEHDSGPSNCAGVPVNNVKRGWVARGGFGDDTLDVAVFNYWYSMTVTTNVPPDVAVTSVVHNTFDTGSQLVEAEIIDCNPAAPANAGVKSAKLIWQVNLVPQLDITMANVGGDTWEATIPGQAPNTIVSYKVYACDSSNVCSYGPPVSYKVAQLGNGYYFVDTTTSWTSKNIRSTGTHIPGSSFYTIPQAADGTNPKDDGTAGPFDMGSNMTLFGDGARYAWVGVNGAIALSKNSTDTVDVNSNGSYTTVWDFPQDPLRKGGRSDTLGRGRMPGNFIAAFWADLFYGDTTGPAFGWIGYQKGYGGDSCLFIVEYDSLGAFAPLGGSATDETTFRIVLNKCDGTIEYQYENVGQLGMDSSALVGMQQDSNSVSGPNPGSVFVNNTTYPYVTKPRNGWCIKFYPSVPTTSINGWNMVSVPVIPVGSNYAVANVFPTAVGSVYDYVGSYRDVATLGTANGPGYWAKFSGVSTVGARGSLLNNVNITVGSGWNLVGSVARPVATASVTVTGGPVVSQYFKYTNTGYVTTTTLVPGQGHWVKMGTAGSLGLNAWSAVPKQSPMTDLDALSRVTIIDAAGRSQALYIGEDSQVKEQLSTYELPPQAPEFDARFSSSRMLETYPKEFDARARYEYPIQIEANAYPVTVQWNMQKSSDRQFMITSADGKLGNMILGNSGSMKITDGSVKSIVLTLTQGGELPKEFALGQNYPNPFNPTTRFNVELPAAVDVQVAIYDILGRQITTLLSGQQSAGYHSIEWDGRDGRGFSVPTGIYFVRMAAAEFSATRKIMLMK